MASPIPYETDTLKKDAIAVANPDTPSNVSSDSLAKKSASVDVRTLDGKDLVDEDQEPVKFTSLFFRRFYKPIDLNAVATRKSVYDDPNLAPHYWPKKDYENLHRFDPKARWTYKEEQVKANLIFKEIFRLILYRQ